jgi:glycine/D-amino acid oxidase-like deaminating enzyme
MQASKPLFSSQVSKEPDSNHSKVVVVGAGLAGTILGRTLERRGVSLQIWDKSLQGSASQVAAGIWCPINFHRLIPGWRAEEAVPKMLRFFAEEEQVLGRKFLHFIPYWKPLLAEEQVGHWRSKMELYPTWLDLREDDPEVFSLKQVCQHWDVKAWGVVKVSGWLDVEGYVQACHQDWTLRGCLHSGLYPAPNLKAEEIEKASGALQENSMEHCIPMVVDARGFFAWKELQDDCRGQVITGGNLPQRSVVSLRPAQGELVEFELEGWPGHVMLKKELFIQPLGRNRFRAGATFEWSRLSPVPTEEGTARLNDQLQKMLGPWWSKVCNLQYKAGIRPSAHDRRPYVGRDPALANHFVFNGFGAKGVLLAPMMAEELADFMLTNRPLHPEAAVGLG